MLTDIQRQSAAIVFRLPPSMMKVFELLVTKPTVTNDMVEGTVNGDGTPAKLIIHRLRQRLRYTTIRINTHHRVGYSFDVGTKAYIMKTINDSIRHLEKEAAE